MKHNNNENTDSNSGVSLVAIKKELEKSLNKDFSKTAAKILLKKALDKGIEDGLIEKNDGSYGPGKAVQEQKIINKRKGFILKVKTTKEAWKVDFGDQKMEWGPQWFFDKTVANKFRKKLGKYYKYNYYYYIIT